MANWKKWICSLLVVSLINVLTCFPGMHFPGSTACAAVPSQEPSVKTLSLIGFILDNLTDAPDDAGAHFHYSIFTVQQKRGATEHQALLPAPLPETAAIQQPAVYQQQAGAYNRYPLSPHYHYLFRLTPF